MVAKFWMAALVLLGAAAPAQVLIVPQAVTVLAGRGHAFQIRMAYHAGLAQAPELGLGPGFCPYPQAGHWAWSILDGGVGTLDEVTGRYTAPGVTRPATVTIQASYRLDPGITAQAKVLVLPHEPFDLVGKVLGPDWLTPLADDLPFWNEAQGERNGTAAVQGLRPRWRMAPIRHYGGCGLPLTLRWIPPPGTEAQALTLGQGEGLVQRQCSAETEVEVTSTDPLRHFTVESLQRAHGAAGLWLSHSQSSPIDMRGLFPMAGNPRVDPGHRDGRGCAARFQHPFGLALVTSWSLHTAVDWACLVSDPVTHVIRRVSPGGEVTTPWGSPGQAGHRDQEASTCVGCLWDTLFHFCGRGNRPPALFNRPTFLSVCPNPRLGDTHPCRVADSGNHVLRLLYEDGNTATLAGVPGQAGHRDSADPRQALFNDPRGLAEDPEGNLYIADRGNRVIRRLTPAGRVETLAGRPGEAGDADGEPAQARFQDLPGLAVFPMTAEPRGLYVVDGHAVRHIALPDGRVTTVLGVVATPGFQDVTQAAMAERSKALLTPCLRDPCGLTAARHGLFIADQGNHAVRAWDVQRAHLSTVAGDPGHGETRWGLVRDGLPGPLDERYAALEAPRSLVPADTGCHFVATGACLAELRHGRRGRDRLQPVTLACTAAQAHHACQAGFAVSALSPGGQRSIRTMYYSVDFLEADGTLAERRQGTALTTGVVSVKGTFTQRGTGHVVVRCVTDQGVSAGAKLAVQVL